MDKVAENYVDYQERSLEFAPGDHVTVYGQSKDVAGRVLAVYPAIGMADVEFPLGARRYPVEELQRLVDGDVDPPRTNSLPAKIALYWIQRDRKYRGNSSETRSGKYCCPKCRRKGVHSILRPATYKRRDGHNEKLLGCPTCLFLVKKSDIINCPDVSEPEEVTDGIY